MQTNVVGRESPEVPSFSHVASLDCLRKTMSQVLPARRRQPTKSAGHERFRLAQDTGPTVPGTGSKKLDS